MHTCLDGPGSACVGDTSHVDCMTVNGSIMARSWCLASDSGLCHSCQHLHVVPNSNIYCYVRVQQFTLSVSSQRVMLDAITASDL